MNRPRWETSLFAISIVVLAISGMGQMPIFKRYYLADIPGFGWLAEYYLLHVIHYTAAIVFLFFLGFWTATRLNRLRQYPLSGLDIVNALILSAVVGTGILRVLKNYPSLSLSILEARIADIGHLVAVILFGLITLVSTLSSRSQTSTVPGKST